MKQATLLFLIDGNKILLALKKRGFGMGKWNGVGGKLNDGETIEQAAVRECQEEIMVNPGSLTKVATLNFYFPRNKPDWDQQVTVYISRKWQGEPTETEEMAPQWFSFNDIPYTDMWADDSLWLAKVLDGQYVEADFHFDDNNAVSWHKLKTKPIN